MDKDEIQRLFPAGEKAAHARLSEFVQKRATRYHVRRDMPHEESGCSMLSAYLNAGVLSTRQCVVAARAANKNKIMAGDEGLKTWIKELGWRVKKMRLTDTRAWSGTKCLHAFFFYFPLVDVFLSVLH